MQQLRQGISWKDWQEGLESSTDRELAHMIYRSSSLTPSEADLCIEKEPITKLKDLYDEICRLEAELRELKQKHVYPYDATLMEYKRKRENV